ncbi:deoxyribodipyrimidine photo-lyase-like [Choristoneura fumiferana]|uniref:deoxyribodipyrimidine photo-lyase-like n=1 Tax=Choristoneura fumiferana TaxID=7141 RepID=UPI003D15DC8C
MASAAKKTKLDLPSTSAESKNTLDEFKKSLQTKRDKTAKSILDYKFNKKRLRIISDQQLVADKCEGIVYWMFRDSRVQDNWSFLFAQKLALNNEVPLHVCFCLSAKYQDASLRHIDFLRKVSLCLFVKHSHLENSTDEGHKIPIDWDEAIESREADKSVGPVEWAKPGYDAAVAMLKSFLDKRLKLYAAKRNDPTQDAISNLSPWIRFGKGNFLKNFPLCRRRMYKVLIKSLYTNAV